MNVILPDEGDTPFQVLWLLHGLSDDHTAWVRQTSIERYVQDKALAVVMPAVNRSFYWDMHKGLKWGTFAREEFPQIARRLFPLSDRREDNFITGLSMGGYGAFLAALTHPDRYAAAASLSGVLDAEGWLEYARKERPEVIPEMENVYGNLDNIATHPANLLFLLRQRLDAGTPLPQLYACCGTEDFLYPGNLVFRDKAKAWGVNLEYAEGPGEHNWAFWDQWIQQVIDWLPLHTTP